ncbi:periplasmic heavy metal sensor [Rhodophyticola porphyridii]|nr:periplasmic heavy metal sensor [Rhodophyticola porphyridii]
MVETPPIPPTAPGPPAPPPRGAGRGVKIALGLSLALNLLIAGIVMGAVWGRLGGPPGSGEAPLALRTLGLGPLIYVLERDDRAALRARMEEGQDRFRPELRGLGHSVHRFGEALRSEPFDRAAAAAALEQQRRNVQGLQTEGHRLLLDQLEAMTPEARADLADRLQRRLSRSMRRGDRSQ